MWLDSLVLRYIAPFQCIGCGVYGSRLCTACQASLIERQISRCYRCHASTLQFQVCASCRKKVKLTHVWVVASYDGMVKELIDQMKFERAGAISEDLGAMMADRLPLLAGDTLVTYLPTTSSRVRVRGFDQAKLLARKIAKTKKLEFVEVFERVGQTRQVGAGREQRISQAQAAYRLKNNVDIAGKTLLIVDDVTTSGASLEAAAALLNKAKAKSIMAIVFAQAGE